MPSNTARAGVTVSGELLSAGGRSFTAQGGDERTSYEAKLLVGEDVLTVRFRDQDHMAAALSGAQARDIVTFHAFPRVAGPSAAARSCWIEYLVGRDGE